MSDAENGPGSRQARILGPVRLLTGGTAGALALTALNVPAGAVVGAVLGSALVGTIRPSGEFPRAGRLLGLVLIGCSAGLGVRRDNGETLLLLIVPLVLGVVVLVAIGAGLAWYLHRRHGVDPMTALFACAPGGISEIAIQASEAGARLEIVLSIHLARVLVVVLVALPLVVAALGHPG